MSMEKCLLELWFCGHLSPTCNLFTYVQDHDDDDEDDDDDGEYSDTEPADMQLSAGM